ncbi:hypothetical protein VCHA54P486_360031 [Vibrio chagasii]|nr:hypothetical protein VCHA54P486_360031 [Vibrio chagasii]
MLYCFIALLLYCFIALLLKNGRMTNYGKAHDFKACRLTPFFKLLATGHWNKGKESKVVNLIDEITFHTTIHHSLKYYFFSVAVWSISALLPLR